MQDEVVSYQHKQGDVVAKEINVNYPAGSVLTLTPDCFLEPCGSVAPGDSGGGVFLADGGSLVGINVGTQQLEIKAFTPANPLHSTHIQIEDENLQASYRARSVLVNFHREWLKESFTTLSAEILSLDPNLLKTGQQDGEIETIEIDLGVKISREGYDREFAITTFPDSCDTVKRAFSAKFYWFCVNNKAMTPGCRFSAAMNLFESPNKAIQATGCTALLALSKDSAITNAYHHMTAYPLFESDSPSICKMGIEAYKYIAEDITADVVPRIDAAQKLIFSLKDEPYRRLGIDLYLSLVEKDHRIIREDGRFATGVGVLLSIEDRKVQDYVIYKLQKLLEDEHTDDQKKKIIKALMSLKMRKEREDRIMSTIREACLNIFTDFL
jgi:hypothetical protein